VFAIGAPDDDAAVSADTDSDLVVDDADDKRPDFTLYTSNSPEAELHGTALLRLLESDVLDVHMALHWLYYNRSAEVHSIIVRRLCDFPRPSVDFYLPQLVNMYVNCTHLSNVLRQYFEYRCSRSVQFSINLAWLLDAYSARASSTGGGNGGASGSNASASGGSGVGASGGRHSRPCHQHALHLRDRILTEQLAPPPLQRQSTQSASATPPPPSQSPQPSISAATTTTAMSALPPSGARHKRCASDAVNALPAHHHQQQQQLQTDTAGRGVVLNRTTSQLPPTEPHLQQQRLHDASASKFRRCRTTAGDLNSGRAFYNGCECPAARNLGIACHCGSPRLQPQLEFVKSLLRLSCRLRQYAAREARTRHLHGELALLNFNLPARVWLPVHGSGHYIVRIPHTAAAVLNSKDKAPYLIYVETEEKQLTIICLIFTKYSAGATAAAPSGAVRRFNADADEFSLASSDGADGATAASAAALASAANAKPFSPADVRRRLSNCTGYAFDSGLSGGSTAANLAGGFRGLSHHQQLWDRDDPSLGVLREPIADKRTRIRDSSPFGFLPSWELRAAIVKTGDDLRQELLAYQVLRLLKWIWELERVPLWLRPLTVTVVGDRAGLIEPVLDTNSLHQIKRLQRAQQQSSLLAYFEQEFGPQNSEAFLEAQKNFVRSTAAYCIVCYLLQVKDRHNGNILLDSRGHMIHIDFGFMLATSPGRNLGFESSHFKLTNEYVDVMGGYQADMYKYFKILILRGMLAARKHFDKIITLVDISSAGSDLPCFSKGSAATLKALKDRFHLSCTELQLQRLMDSMVESSLHSISTKLYDSFQYLTNGIE
uniref:Phosphatidylinositol 4-kinase beta n=1 Tax=Macrostomum lignano TaxID=282301 RepID=A0A1I8GUX6_9PLAT